MLGTTIGHYRVLELLGEGKMGQVFLAEDLKLQRRADLKLISPTLTRDETRRQRFVQEARVAASIDPDPDVPELAEARARLAHTPR